MVRSLTFIIVFLIGALNSSYAANKDSSAYTLYKEKLVLFADYGFNSAPFSLRDNYNLGVKTLRYKTNLKGVLGFGFAYKWLGLRIGFTLPGNLRATKDYGTTAFLDAGLRINIKQAFASIDFRLYRGYAIKNAYKWNDTLTSSLPNAISPNVQAASLSFNLWFFRNKDVTMPALLGVVGHYERPAKTWYFKGTLNFFGVSNDTMSIVPVELLDTTERIGANSIGAVDLGFIPGYVYVNRVNNWQFSIFAGIGGVIQSKFYISSGVSRGFLGLAPRIDLGLNLGYSVPKFFIFLNSDFDIKSLSIQELSYNQMFYNVKLISGFRIGNHKPK